MLNMKTRILGLMALIITSLSFTACDDDDDANSLLVGKWQQTHVIDEESYDLDETFEDCEWEEKTNARVEFTSDGIMKGWELENGTWEFAGGMPYKYSDGKITIPEMEGSATVVKLTDNELVLHEGGIERYQGQSRPIKWIVKSKFRRI